MSKKNRGKPRSGKTRKERRREGRSAGASRTAPPATEPPPAQSTPMFPVISDHAGLTAMDHGQRTQYLGQFNLASKLHAVAAIQSRLDVASSTDWSEDRVERELLAESGTEWATRLASLVGSTHRLIPPRSMTQLIREALEHVEVEDVAPRRDIEIADILVLVMSITTEHLEAQNPLDAVANPDPAQLREQMAAVAAYTAEETVAAVRQDALDEIANLQSNESVKLELIMASTYDLWFRPWPARVTDTRIGENPAAAFELANRVPLLDVMVVGQIITEGITAGRFEFTREELTRAGATTDAVEFVIKNTAYDAAQFTRRLRHDRSRGPVAYQRYAFTERPFLQQGADTLLVLRYQWVIDRFFGSQLYWQTFFAFGAPTPRSVAEAFSQAMNYAFERVANDILTRIAAHSSKITRLVTETEMQDEWTENRGQAPSVCDFMLVAGRACILIDATNHHLSANLAQGLADIDTFNTDIESSFVTTKFNQIVSTAKLVIEHLSFGVEANPVFYPYVVVPNNGLPNTTAVQLDWRVRAVAPFAELQGSTRPPVPLRIGDLALFEGLADYFTAPGRDIADLFGGWTNQRFPVSLRQLLDQNNMPAPIPQRMIRDQKTLDRLISDRRHSTQRE
jgi:hypothetical protein